MKKKYKKIALGGTFDHFHKGHEHFLNNAFSISEKVLIGITSDVYILKNKEKDLFETLETRKKTVLTFLKKKNLFKKAEIVVIENRFGPTLTDKEIDAIFVHKESVEIAKLINLKREKNKLKKLKIVLTSIILAGDKEKISSKRIRNGEMNRNGEIYIRNDWLKGKLLLPDNLRKELIKPFGKILKNNFTFKTKYGFSTVGDITTIKANKKKKTPLIAVFDFLVKREKTFKNIKELGFEKEEKVVRVVNPAGTITSNLFKVIISAFKKKKKKLLLVKGEDDLAVLPLILCAPLNFYIYYGQPNQGIVEIMITEEVKEKAYKLALKFKKIN